MKLPDKLAKLLGQETIEVEEERDGMSSVEMTFWRAYYELQAEKNKKSQK